MTDEPRTYTRQGKVCALAILFAAHTGVRAAELQGLHVQDVTLSDIPGTVGSIRVVRPQPARMASGLRQIQERRQRRSHSASSTVASR